MQNAEANVKKRYSLEVMAPSALLADGYPTGNGMATISILNADGSQVLSTGSGEGYAAAALEDAQPGTYLVEIEQATPDTLSVTASAAAYQAYGVETPVTIAANHLGAVAFHHAGGDFTGTYRSTDGQPDFGISLTDMMGNIVVYGSAPGMVSGTVPAGNYRLTLFQTGVDRAGIVTVINTRNSIT